MDTELKRTRFLREYGDLLGAVSDAELARRAGYINESYIGKIRTELNIEPTVHGNVNKIVTDPDLFNVPAAEIAARYGVSTKVIYDARKKRRKNPEIQSVESFPPLGETFVDRGVILVKDVSETSLSLPLIIWCKVKSFFKKLLLPFSKSECVG